MDVPLMPVDLTELLRENLLANQREPDGLLHASGDLVGSMRHSMLRAAGAPTNTTNIAGDVNLLVGTLLHDYLAQMLVAAGIPFQQEVKLGDYLPEGWSGRADLIVWNKYFRKWVLVDIKSIRGEGLWYVEANGAKEDHIWQVSAYYWALVNMGLDMHPMVGVYYLPKYNLRHKALEPVLCEVNPLQLAIIKKRMTERWDLTVAYLDSIKDYRDVFVTDELAPVQDRVQKLVWNKNTGGFDLILVPHWSAEFCPFPDELCDCNTQGQTKIGVYWVDWAQEDLPVIYEPTTKGAGIEPTEVPTLAMFEKKGKR